MIGHFRASDLLTDGAGPGFKVLYTSDDGALEVGFWDFTGTDSMPSRIGYEEIIIPVAGTLEVDAEGQSYLIELGDIAVYDPPVGAKAIQSTGLRAFCIVRRHSS
jgi:hypothetical protein